MATYNDAIDDAIKVICPGEKPCDCARKEQPSGFWMTNCVCCQIDDCAAASVWCAAKNTAENVAKLKQGAVNV